VLVQLHELGFIQQHYNIETFFFFFDYVLYKSTFYILNYGLL